MASDMPPRRPIPIGDLVSMPWNSKETRNAYIASILRKESDRGTRRSGDRPTSSASREDEDDAYHNLANAVLPHRSPPPASASTTKRLNFSHKKEVEKEDRRIDRAAELGLELSEDDEKQRSGGSGGDEEQPVDRSPSVDVLEEYGIPQEEENPPEVTETPAERLNDSEDDVIIDYAGPSQPHSPRSPTDQKQRRRRSFHDRRERHLKPRRVPSHLLIRDFDLGYEGDEEDFEGGRGANWRAIFGDEEANEPIVGRSSDIPSDERNPTDNLDKSNEDVDPFDVGAEHQESAERNANCVGDHSEQVSPTPFSNESPCHDYSPPPKEPTTILDTSSNDGRSSDEIDKSTEDVDHFDASSENNGTAETASGDLEENLDRESVVIIDDEAPPQPLPISIEDGNSERNEDVDPAPEDAEQNVSKKTDHDDREEESEDGGTVFFPRRSGKTRKISVMDEETVAKLLKTPTRPANGPNRVFAEENIKLLRSHMMCIRRGPDIPSNVRMTPPQYYSHWTDEGRSESRRKSPDVVVAAAAQEEPPPEPTFADPGENSDSSGRVIFPPKTGKRRITPMVKIEPVTKKRRCCTQKTPIVVDLTEEVIVIDD